MTDHRPHITDYVDAADATTVTDDPAADAGPAHATLAEDVGEFPAGTQLRDLTPRGLGIAAKENDG